MHDTSGAKIAINIRFSSESILKNPKERTFAVMNGPDFKFKQFSIRQDMCPMKVGTDGVLLGAWAGIGGCRRILDIGTGTGLIALMAAQRNADAEVYAIDIDPGCAVQAARNADASPWARRIHVMEADVRHFMPKFRFDAILCNPPYFTNSLRCPQEGRSLARHDCSLNFDQLSEAAARLLEPDGELSLVLPYEASAQFIGSAAIHGLQLHSHTRVITKSGKAPKRSLLSFGTGFQEATPNDLIIAEEDGSESAEYINLVKDFYLKY